MSVQSVSMSTPKDTVILSKTKKTGKNKKTKKNPKPVSDQDDIDAYLDSLQQEMKETNTVDQNDTDQNKKTTSSQETPFQPSEETLKKFYDFAFKEAYKLRDAVKAEVEKNPSYSKIEDNKKMKLFDEFGSFMQAHPVVARYMICMGQFSGKAFKRYLDRCINMKHPASEDRAKDYMEDQRIRRQADYIQFLWEASQTGHPNMEEARWHWRETYKILKGELDDFRNKHDEVKKSVEEEKKQSKKEIMKEMLERVRTGAQKLSEEDEKELIWYLKQNKYENNYKKCLANIRELPLIQHTSEGLGMGPPEPEKDPKSDPKAWTKVM